MALLAAIAAAVTLIAAPTYTVGQVQRSFRAQTRTPLVLEPSASTDAVTTLVTRPRSTPRFGRFELYVLRPSTARATLRALLGGARRNANGIYWTRDQNAGWIATTVYGRNLAAGWFPPRGAKRVDARWTRLQTVLRRIPPG